MSSQESKSTPPASGHNIGKSYNEHNSGWKRTDDTIFHLGVEGRLGTPPPYEQPAAHDTSDNVREAPPRPANQIYEENEYGEMRPTITQTSDAYHNSDTDTGLHPPGLTRVPSDVVYVEDEFGEIHPEKIEREHHHLLHLRNHRGTSRSRSSESGEAEENHLDEDASHRSADLHADRIYPENRFGELGRADTIGVEHTHFTEKIKETAEKFVGKLTSHKEHHDKDVERTGPKSID